MSKIEKKLSPEIVEMLGGEKIVSIITVNKDTKKPQLSVVSWVLASETGMSIKIAVGHKGTTIENLESDPSVVLGIIGPDSCYSITGKASVSEIVHLTMKYRVITVEIDEVEDVMFYGGKVTVQPAYEKTYNAELAKQLDSEVYELLKTHNS
jgi:hypothetical protein